MTDRDPFQQFREQSLAQVMRDPNLSAAAIRVAICIALHINRKSGDAWPSVAAIMAACALSRSSVFRALAQLESRGHIAIAHGRGRQPNTNTSAGNRYRLTLHEPGKGVCNDYLEVSPVTLQNIPSDTATELELPFEGVIHGDLEVSPVTPGLSEERDSLKGKKERGASAPSGWPEETESQALSGTHSFFENAGQGGASPEATATADRPQARGQPVAETAEPIERKGTAEPVEITGPNLEPVATSAETAQADPSQADPRSPPEADPGPRYGSPEWWRLRIAAYVAEDAKHRTAADHAFDGYPAGHPARKAPFDVRRAEWDDGDGPRPGHVGCRVPPEILSEFGYAPAAASKAAPAAARAPLRRPQPIPDGWRPDADGIAYARAAGLGDARITQELETFRLWWTDKGGRSADWGVKWALWVNRAKAHGPARRRPSDDDRQAGADASMFRAVVTDISRGTFALHDIRENPDYWPRVLRHHQRTREWDCVLGPSPNRSWRNEVGGAEVGGDSALDVTPLRVIAGGRHA